MYQPSTDPLLSDVTTTRIDTEIAASPLRIDDRIPVVDPATGLRYLIAVEDVREADDGHQVTGRVVAPRRARGSIITTTVRVGRPVAEPVRA